MVWVVPFGVLAFYWNINLGERNLMGIDGSLRRKLPEDKRINVPADPNHYWRYRMHIGLEELVEMERLNDTLKGILERTDGDEFQIIRHLTSSTVPFCTCIGLLE